MAREFRQAPHAFVVVGITLVLSVQLLSLGVLALQAKQYFEELFHFATRVYAHSLELERLLSERAAASVLRRIAMSGCGSRTRAALGRLRWICHRRGRRLPRHRRDPWTSQVGRHETLYLLGSRCIADPQFLAVDFTWSHLSPTTFLYDHLLAPLWSVFGEFAIANIGRFAAWLLTAWSLAALARAARIPAWSVVVGFTVWLLWGQTLVTCGSPLEGFQVKSFAYPLVFFSLAFAMRGRIVRAPALRPASPPRSTSSSEAGGAWRSS